MTFVASKLHDVHLHWQHVQNTATSTS